MKDDFEALASIAIDTAMGVHVDLGPGLLETVYETVLAKRISDRGYKVGRQLPIRIHSDGFVFPEGFRADLLIQNRLLIEIKSAERLAPVHTRQVLTYLRMMNLPLGLLMNFGGVTFKEGLKRVANNYRPSATRPL
jgi:GxxExxY protein